MTYIQQVLWELQLDYIGHPYYVTGNAILHAISQQLTARNQGMLSASHGIFVPGQYGRFPENHSQSGAHPCLGGNLPEVKSYDDLFIHRNPSHPWLLDIRARDTLNTHDIRRHNGQLSIAHETIIGRKESKRKQQRTTKWYIHAHIHADSQSMLPLEEETLDGLQFGGKRNYGYGKVRLKDTVIVDIDELDYSQIKDADSYILKLLSPFVIETEYNGASNDTIPWWWEENLEQLRVRQENVLRQQNVVKLRTIDHGQVVKYRGNSPVETAKNGITRVGSHSQWGFGEFRIKPINN